MNYAFNYFKQAELPALTLCNPSKTELYALPLAFEVKNAQKYNAISTLDFKYPQSKKYEQNIIADPAYNFIKGKNLVLVPNVGYYIIQNCPEDNSGAIPTKSVSCMSLESELLNKRLTGFSGTFQFAVVLQLALDLIPTWSIGYIDPLLLPVYRTFNSNNNTVFKFINTDMETAFSCVFKFDTFNRTVSAYSTTIPYPDTNIYLSYDNLIKKTVFTEVTDELVTSLYCYGGGGLDIHQVNPTGGNNIYNFSYFKTTEWMSQGLIDVLSEWEEDVAYYQPIYASTLTQLETYGNKMIGLLADLSDLNAQLKTLYDILADEIKAGHDHSTTDAKIKAQLLLIASKDGEIADCQASIDATNMKLRKIVHALYFTSKISYDNFYADVLDMQATLVTISKTWGDTYYDDSVYPNFNKALFDAEKQGIVASINTAQTQMSTLGKALNVGFSSYPPSSDDQATLVGYINDELDTLNSLYSTLSTLIPSTSITIAIDAMITELTAYIDIIPYPSNMTEAQYLELVPYILDNVYTNQNVIITDIMTPVQIQAQSQDLYDQATTVLTKVSQPHYQFTGEFVNFVSLIDFDSFTSELDLGKVINVQKDDSTIIYAVLLEMDITYDNPTEFTMTFGNSFRLNSPRFIYADILGTAAQLSAAV